MTYFCSAVFVEITHQLVRDSPERVKIRRCLPEVECHGERSERDRQQFDGDVQRLVLRQLRHVERVHVHLLLVQHVQALRARILREQKQVS